MVQGGWINGTSPYSSGYVAVFRKKKITLSRKSLIVPALQDEVYFIDGRPAGGL